MLGFISVILLENPTNTLRQGIGRVTAAKIVVMFCGGLFENLDEKCVTVDAFGYVKR